MNYMMKQSPKLPLFILLLCLTLLTVFANESRAESEKQQQVEWVRFFEEHVRPLLLKHCIDCHGPKKQFAELRLDAREHLLKGGESGPAIVVNQPEDSLLISAVKRESLEMPPDQTLSPDEIRVLSTWIEQGAVWPDSARLADTKSIDFSRHWSFQPIQSPPRPAVQNTSWPQNDIDYFILARLEAEQLSPSPPAAPATLLRRMHWDLTGLLPTYSEIETFANSFSPAVSQATVDKLLDSPHYGERWGRHWLDLARYADTKGYVFFEKPTFHNAFTYRDYVIDSFNQDKPFNQFVLEQLAADYLTDDLPHETLAALGFITVGPRFKNDTHDIISDRIDVVTRGFLGLTVGCARCHDHKYDPISIEDYYSLYGVFRNSLQPIDLPFRDHDSLSPQLAEQAQKIQQTAQELNQLYQQKHRKVLEDTHQRLAEYLTVAQSQRNGPDTVKFDVIVDGDDLNPEVLLLWQEFLDLSEKNEDPVFSLWHKLAKLPAANFQPQALKLLQHSVQNQKTSPTERLIAVHLLNQHPQTFDDVIRGYAGLFKQINQAWDTRIVTATRPGQQKTSQPFPAAKTDVLNTFYSPHSPLVMPLHGYTVLRLFPDRKQQQKVKELNDALDQARAAAPAELAQMLALQDAKQIIEPRVFKRGNPGMPAQSIPRRYLHFFDQVSAEPFTQGSGRLELAQAIISPENPLTARVIVNRVWQHHFGQGLVSTPSDFGIQGAKPSHPELLDHLARWFMQHDWSIKQLHRYIMSSATYQQQSHSNVAGEKRDPANKLLWRMNRRRQDFETMRDTLLQVSQQLNLTVGGKSVRGIAATANKRRTLYTFIDRQNVPGLLRTFDFPSPDVSSGARNSTSVPGQSLFLMNHPLVLNAARILGEQAHKSPDSQVGIRQLFQSILQREPTTDELQAMQQFLESDQVESPAAPVIAEWEYGYGAYDEKTETLSGFKSLPFWNGKQYQGGNKLPDPKIGWVFLDNTGGHPGNDMQHVAVIRWRAPETMTVSLHGKLSHELPQGNGVRGRVLIAGKKVLGPWTLHQKSVDTNLEKIQLKQGQTIDFVVDIAGQLGFDSFVWSPKIKTQSLALTAASGEKPERTPARQWNYSRDFRKPEPVRITPWQSLAQILLLSNEFQFID